MTLAEEIATRRGISVSAAQSLIDASRDLWRALDALGMVDAWGGAEYERIFPEAIDAIHKLANPLAYADGDR